MTSTNIPAGMVRSAIRLTTSRSAPGERGMCNGDCRATAGQRCCSGRSLGSDDDGSCTGVRLHRPAEPHEAACALVVTFGRQDEMAIGERADRQPHVDDVASEGVADHEHVGPRARFVEGPSEVAIRFFDTGIARCRIECPVAPQPFRPRRDETLFQIHSHPVPSASADMAVQNAIVCRADVRRGSRNGRSTKRHDSHATANVATISIAIVETPGSSRLSRRANAKRGWW